MPEKVFAMICVACGGDRVFDGVQNKYFLLLEQVDRSCMRSLDFASFVEEKVEKGGKEETLDGATRILRKVNCEKRGDGWLAGRG